MAHRSERIHEEIAHLAATFLVRESNRTSLITVTRATTSDDGKYATIFFTVLPESKEPEALDFLKRKRSDFKEYVKNESRIGRIPFFDFVIDTGEKNRQRIDVLSQE